MPSLFSHRLESNLSTTSAEAEIYRNSEFLSEAFMASSDRARDALPKQHRAHFDELRREILAFCDEFQIPKDTLGNIKAFEDSLRSKEIPPERMAQAVSLFQQLEHLVTHGEPFKEKTLEYADRLYRLTEQYNAQVAFLEQADILKDGAITGIDGQEYLLPTLEQIAQKLFERREELSPKRDQGFTKLLLVPFGMSLGVLTDLLNNFLLSYKKDHQDFNVGTNQKPFSGWENDDELDTQDPPLLIYNPKSFTFDNHQGFSKREVLEQQARDPLSFPGWIIHLFQPEDPRDPTSKGFAPIPLEGRGKVYGEGEEHPRPDLDAYHTPNQYLGTLQKAKDNPSSPYFLETGLTPEDWIVAFMIHLQETGTPLDNTWNNKEGGTCLLRCFYKAARLCRILYMYWTAANNVSVDVQNADQERRTVGVRTSVIL